MACDATEGRVKQFLVTVGLTVRLTSGSVAQCMVKPSTM